MNIDKEAEKNQAYFVAELNKYDKLYSKSFRKYETDILKLYLSNIKTAQIRPELLRALRESGYLSIAENFFSDGYKNAMLNVQEFYLDVYDLSGELGAQALERMQNQKAIDSIRFTKIADGMTNEITQAFLIKDSVEQKQAIESMRNIIAKYERFNEAENRVANRALNNLSHIEVAGSVGLELFKYQGHLGGDIRRFCNQWVGKIKTIEEWNQLDNGKGQPKPVSTYCGGYNCHHYMVAVLDKSDELSDVEKEKETAKINKEIEEAKNG